MMAPFVIVRPFISHIATSPVDEFRQMMSVFPSPLKSPKPWTFHAGSIVRMTAPLVMVRPLSSQIATSLVETFRHSRSESPSPLKSIATRRVGGGGGGGGALTVTTMVALLTVPHELETRTQ